MTGRRNQQLAARQQLASVVTTVQNRAITIYVGDIVRPWWCKGNWTLYRVLEIYQDHEALRQRGEPNAVRLECVVVTRNNGTRVKRGTRKYTFAPSQMQRVTEEIIQREIAAKMQDLTYRAEAATETTRGIA